MKTFEDVIEELGAGTVYSGTSVDNATKGALLEWLFDLYICTGDDAQKFCRYYRRQLNMVYPMYLDYLKLETARDEMNAFITEYIDRTHEDEKTLSGSSTRTSEGSQTGTGRVEDTTDNTTVRTPDITVAGTSSNTETRDLAGSSDSDGTNHQEAENNGKSRAVAIAYPEANLNSLPLDIDSMPTSVDYASSEQDNFTKSTNEADTTTHTETSTTDTGTVDNSGATSSHETGTEQTDFDGSNIRVSSDSKSIENTDTMSNSGTEANESSEHEQGRHESEADILPRAIKAVTTTNAIKWLVKSLQVCFDNFSEL